MPWREASTMSLRREFIVLARQDGANRRELCRRFGISPKTGYKWLERYAREGEPGLADRSRRPQHSPARLDARMEQVIVELRQQYPAWGPRKLARRLRELGYRQVPSPSTITAVLRRRGLLTPTPAPHAFQRFEHPEPNALWQMDFKGHFALARGRCHPLTILDDHSRFNVALKACANEQGAVVQQHLTHVFRCYGLPQRLLVDNGPPWGSDAAHALTPLTLWLMRLGIEVTHSRPYHPQTLGKDERFHRTLKLELLRRTFFLDLVHCQQHFDSWRDIYNLERPHEALGMEVPASRYQPSPRPFPESLPPIEYWPGDEVRKVQDKGRVCYRGRVFRVSKALRGQPVALRPGDEDHLLSVYFCNSRVGTLDLRNPIE